MKSLLLIAAVSGFALIASTSVQAGGGNKSGNPYGNGTFFNDSATFSAVSRGTVVLSNSTSGAFPTYPVIAIYQFSTGVNQFGGTNGNNATNGVGYCTVFAGDLMSGQAPIGVYNAQASQVSASYYASNVYSSTITNTNANFAGPSGGVVPIAARGSMVGALTPTFPTQTFTANNEDAPMSITYLAYDNAGTNTLTVNTLITNLTTTGYRLGN